MNLDKILTDEKELAKAVSTMKNAITDRNNKIFKNYYRIVRSQEWKDQMKLENAIAWDNRMAKRKAGHRKKYAIPELLYYANVDYWKQAVNDHKFMKKYHPELIINQQLKSVL